MHTSKNAVRITMATPRSAGKSIASVDVMMAPMKSSSKIRRGLTNRLPIADRSRPMVNAEWLNDW